MAYLKFRKIVLESTETLQGWYEATKLALDPNTRYTVFSHTGVILGEYIGAEPVGVPDGVLEDVAYTGDYEDLINKPTFDDDSIGTGDYISGVEVITDTSGGSTNVTVKQTKSKLKVSTAKTAASGDKLIIADGADGSVLKAGITLDSSGKIPLANVVHQDISGKENVSNKKTNLTSPNDTTYPTTRAVKTAIDTAISSVLEYKGSVASYANLPSTEQKVGDFYNVTDTGINYAWTGSGWDQVGGVTNIPIFSGATASVDGEEGLVPKPLKADREKFLKGDGNWTTIATTDTKNTAGSTQDSAEMFVIGAKTQGANPQTYSNSKVKIKNSTIEIGGKAVIVEGDSRLTNARTPLSHTHGNITNTGTISDETSVATNFNLVGTNTSGAIVKTNVKFNISNSGFLKEDGTWETPTTNTAGTTDKKNTKLFLAGAETQSANPQTYSNEGVYIGADNLLYANNKAVALTTDVDDRMYAQYNGEWEALESVNDLRDAICWDAASCGPDLWAPRDIADGGTI